MKNWFLALCALVSFVGCEPVIVGEDGDIAETSTPAADSPSPIEEGDGQCDGCTPDVIVGGGDDDDAVGESPAPSSTPADPTIDPTVSPTPADPVTPTPVGGFVDSDNDGVGDSADCDSADPGIYPGADEQCDGIDNNCDEMVDEGVCETPPPATPVPEVNVDGDGYSVEDGDCDDNDPFSYPGAEEECGDGVDQDCDEQDETCPSSPTPIPDEPTPTPIPVDPNTVDNDGDSLTELEGDCDDLDPLVYTGAPERCNGFDDDCDGSVQDEDCDGDNFAKSIDCDDTDAGIYPTAPETCDGIDEDCDEEVDENPVSAPIWYLDEDLDGYGFSASSTAVCVRPAGYVSDNSDCDDSAAGVHPSASETCENGIDEDCDGQDENCPSSPTPIPDEPTPTPVDPDTTDDDGDGFSEIAGDCDDEDPAIKPSAIEVCDSVDNDCDSAVDEGNVCVIDPLEGFTDGVCDESDILLDDGVLYVGSLCMPSGVWRSSEARIVSDVSAGTLDWDPTDSVDSSVLVSGYSAYEFDFFGLSVGEYQFQFVSSIATDGQSAVSSSESSWKWLQNAGICNGASNGSGADELCRITDEHDDNNDGTTDWYSFMFAIFINADGSVTPFGDGI